MYLAGKIRLHPISRIRTRVRMQNFGSMKVDLKLVNLKHMGKTPSMATCERCHNKFFTPIDLLKSPQEAVENLRNQFSRHKCASLDKHH